MKESEDLAAGRSGVPDRPGDAGDDLSVLRPVTIVLRSRWAIIGFPLAMVALVVVLTLLQEPRFTARAQFMPQQQDRQASRVAGLAAQFGVDLSTASDGLSPQFYADLLHSREILERVALEEFRIRESGEGGGARANLVELYEVEGGTEPERLMNAVRRLRENVDVTVNRETGVVSFSVKTPWRDVSVAVAERLLTLINEFDRRTRRSQASEEREFIEGQLREAEEALLAEEDSLQAFLDRNLRIDNSPQLRFQRERLQRRVVLRQEVYTSLAQSLEQAKIQEVRNTPVITIVESPQTPPRADPRRLKVKVALASILGLLFALMWAFGREYMARVRQTEPEEYDEFRRAQSELKDEVRDWVSRVPGLSGSGRDR